MAVRSGQVLLSDVATAAGVSLATASRALNGQTGVGAELAEKVRVVARNLGYVPNVHARQLAGGTTSVIGLIVHEIDDPFFTEIAGGIVRSALAENLMVQVSHSGRDPEQELQEITTLVVQDVDGIIIAGSGYVDPAKEAGAKEVLRAYQQRGGRVAVIGRHHLGVDAVLPDNVAVGALAGQHLVGTRPSRRSNRVWVGSVDHDRRPPHWHLFGVPKSGGAAHRAAGSIQPQRWCANRQPNR